MSKAARVADAALDRCEVLLALEPDARDTKAIVDATRAALETDRKARNLDEPSPRDHSSPYANLTDEELEAELRRAGGG